MFSYLSHSMVLRIISIANTIPKLTDFVSILIRSSCNIVLTMVKFRVLSYVSRSVNLCYYSRVRADLTDLAGMFKGTQLK